jgi:putative Ca2+/H+ antiporter (TMEM165/GDT1 family)
MEERRRMHLKIFATVFVTIFLAELGDKTQLATFLYAAETRNPKLVVFLASATALILASALAVMVGSAVSRYLNPKYVSWIAGMGFIAVGIWTLARA